MPLLETIVAEVDRLRDITEEYLVYARLPSPNLEPNSLLEIAQNLVEFHQFEWAQAGVEVVLSSLRDEGAPVLVDANQIRQALLNLIRNAVEASPAGQKVLVRIDALDGHARIEIEDRGPGIPAQRRAHIFEPFFTTKTQGTGLGLAMTQQIIEEHQGQIEALAAPDGGTIFVITLPLSTSRKHTSRDLA